MNNINLESSIRISSVSIAEQQQQNVSWKGRLLSIPKQLMKQLKSIKATASRVFTCKSTRQNSTIERQEIRAVQKSDSNIKSDFVQITLSQEPSKQIGRSAEDLQKEMIDKSINHLDITREKAVSLLNSQTGPAWLLRYTTHTSPRQVIISSKDAKGVITHSRTRESALSSESSSLTELKENFRGYKFISPQPSKTSNWESIQIDFAHGYEFQNMKPEYYKNFKKACESENIAYKFKFDDKTCSIIAACSNLELLALASRHYYYNELRMIGNISHNIFKGHGPIGLDFKRIGQDIEQEEQDLIKEANIFFKEREPKSVNLNLPTSLSKLTNHQLISEIFKQHEGCFIGEFHTHISSKKFLIEQMQELKQEGVKTLFLEHIPGESMQSELDFYFSSPDKEMPPNLASYLDYQDQMQSVKDKKYGFKALVEAAKLAGIRVVAFDTEASYNITSENYAPDARCRTMNYLACQIIESEKEKGKYIALVGGAHVCQYKGVYGLSELLGQPNIVIADSANEKLEMNVKGLRNELEGTVNVYWQQKV